MAEDLKLGIHRQPVTSDIGCAFCCVMNQELLAGGGAQHRQWQCGGFVYFIFALRSFLFLLLFFFLFLFFLSLFLCICALILLLLLLDSGGAVMNSGWAKYLQVGRRLAQRPDRLHSAKYLQVGRRLAQRPDQLYSASRHASRSSISIQIEKDQFQFQSKARL